LVTQLLQRLRVADPDVGMWEAADLQWSWRLPRRSDQIDQLFWVDDDGPVAGVVLTESARTWGCDPLVVPGSTVVLAEVWQRAVQAIGALGLISVEMFVRDDDIELRALATADGFVPTDERLELSWMDRDERVEVTGLAEGFTLTDRVHAKQAPHPMARRNGEEPERRLRQCSLYDPSLDLAVVTTDGDVAGYSLFWFDPVTKVGLLEPMRVEDDYQRRGLATAMLSAGTDRLARRGALRIKVCHATDAARALYTGAGFRVRATMTAFALSSPSA
jgi:GNAT superfamily N-acetyltransferase